MIENQGVLLIIFSNILITAFKVLSFINYQAICCYLLSPIPPSESELQTKDRYEKKDSLFFANDNKNNRILLYLTR